MMPFVAHDRALAWNGSPIAAMIGVTDPWLSQQSAVNIRSR